MEFSPKKLSAIYLTCHLFFNKLGSGSYISIIALLESAVAELLAYLKHVRKSFSCSLTPERRQSKMLSTIDERGSKIDRTLFRLPFVASGATNGN